jgi:hypothetical protein
MWSQHSCWVPYYEWKDVFQTLIPVELEYGRIELLQRDNTHHFRNMYKLSPPSAKQYPCMSYVPVILVSTIVLISLYHIIQTFL